MAQWAFRNTKEKHLSPFVTPYGSRLRTQFNAKPDHS